MSNASETFREELLNLIFRNIAIANIGDSSGLQPSTADGNLYVRLCTDAVTPDFETLGTECDYTGYVAGGVAVARDTGWELDGSNDMVIAADLEFATSTDAVSQNVKYAELWRNNTGALEADRIAWLELDAVVAVSEGITPRFAAGTLKFRVL